MSRPRVLAGLIGLGVLLRVVLVLGAEHQLGADESTVALMALELLQGGPIPFFYTEQAYNGGAAFEAWLGAVVFAVSGPSAIPLKLTLLAIWTLTAALFASLVARVESRTRATLAVAFFVLATPFFLEWSVKVRGGFAETLLFSVLLLHLAAPPAALRRRVGLRAAVFGLIAGVAIWASEMILAMLPLAAAWLIARLDQSAERRRAIAAMALGLGLGLLPLLYYNVTHDWRHVRVSVLTSFLWREGEATTPLSLEQLALSTRFVLGSMWGLLSFGVGLGAYRSLRSGGSGLSRVALLHVGLYLLAYWGAGLRYDPIPPSRVLYVLLPSLAVLLAYAVAWTPTSSRLARGVAFVSIAAWLFGTTSAVTGWLASGVPRETGSWRGSWGLIDAEELDRTLAGAGLTAVFANMWTAKSLRFATQARAHREGTFPLEVRYEIPFALEAHRGRAGIVLHGSSRAAGHVEAFLAEQNISHDRIEVGQLTLFLGIPAHEIHQRRGLPKLFAAGDWPPLPEPIDGFN